MTFSNIDVEHLNQGPNAGNQSWLVIMVENQSNDGGGPIQNVMLSHIKVRDSGSTAARIDGLSAASPVGGVTLDSIRQARERIKKRFVSFSKKGRISH